MRAAVFMKGGQGSGNFGHRGRPGMRGGSSPRTREVRMEKRRLHDLYRFTLSSPLADPDAAVALLRPGDLEVLLDKGPAVEGRDGQIKVTGRELMRTHGTKRGYGMVKILWRHGERSPKRGTNMQVTKGDVLRLPEVLRTPPSAVHVDQQGEPSHWVWESRRFDGQTVVYVVSRHGERDNRLHVVTVHVQDPQMKKAMRVPGQGCEPLLPGYRPDDSMVVVRGAATPSATSIALVWPVGKTVAVVADADGWVLKGTPAGARWITVHPNGREEKGVPVLVQETKRGSGVFHVIGGAGGKLNYLKLRGVRDESDYRQEAAERKKAKAEEKKAQRAQEKAAGTYEPKAAARAQVQEQQREAERAFIREVAASQGWEGHEFDAEAHSGLSERAQKKAAERHHREWLKKAKAAVDQQRERLVHDADARAAALGDGVPLDSDDPAALSVDDLAPVQAGGGLGFSTDYGKRAKDNGLSPGELKLERERLQQGKPEGERQAGAKRKATAEAIAEELKGVREPAPKEAENKLVAAEQAVALLKAEKKLKAIQREARAARREIDEAAEPKGAYVLAVSGAEVDDAAAQALEEDLRTISTKAFLSEVGKLADDPDQSLGRHIGVGAYNAINAVAVTAAGAPLLDRSVVDVLGMAGAAQVLARRLHRDLSAEELADVQSALAAYHMDHYLQATEEALKEAMRWQKVASEIQLDEAHDAADLVRAQELLAQRKEVIGHAERIMGTTLGEVEANAALSVALQQGAKNGIEVNLGKMSLDDAVRRARAIGLQRGDYEINTVGGERFLKISGEGMDRLANPVDRESLNATHASMRIIEGHEDEEGWLPRGVADRPDLATQVPAGVAPRLAEPFTPGDDMERAVRDYIGGRTADGDAPADIVADLLSDGMARKAGDRAAYFAAVDRLAPLRGEDGKMVRAEEHADRFRRMAEEFTESRYGLAASPLHLQTFPQDQVAVESLHRALAAEPTGVAAFKAVGDLSRGEQKALRDWWAREIGYRDEGAQALRTELERMDAAEPERETDDMFGRGTNPAWVEWRQRRDGLAEQLGKAELTWPKYAKLMGGPTAAYRAVQELVRGRVAEKFAATHNTLRPEAPIKVGRTVISGNLSHLDAVDPEARERRLEQQRQMADALRERSAGRYAAGTVREKMDAAREAKAAMEQSQMGLFGAEEEPEHATPLAADQRHTLGHAAERQIAAMMPIVGENFRAGKPVKLWRASMNGRYINQQRAIKLIDRNRRVVLAQGVGSGKSIIGLSAFTNARERGQAKRGLFVVPSIVQEQFGGEALRYLEPGKYRWHAEPGASREERLAAYRDPDTHFVVVTHQSFRDDMLHLGAEQAGITPAEMTDRLHAMSQEERKGWAKGVMDAHGMDHDYLFVDEGHDLLNRAGKEDSTLSNVVDPVAHNSKYYVVATADPVKNDPSEVYDLLHKMDPDRYHDPKAFMRRYGVDTAASKDELRRELARYFYPGRIDPGVQAHRSEVTVPLTAGQQRDLAEADHHLAAVRLARMKGNVATEEVKALSPSSFEGVPAERHDEVASKLARNLGPLRQMAHRRILDAHPEAGKLDALSQFAGDRKGKPGVVFAHSLQAVHQVAERLRKEGHRVVVLTGADSAKEKGRKRQAFNPESGDASADILVASDAGAVGMNVQRGQWLVNYDTPDTAKTHAQRNGRIHRLGQKNDVELVDLVADHPSERRARKRLAEKYDLRGIMTSPLEGLDDTGLAAYLHQARVEREQGGLF